MKPKSKKLLVSRILVATLTIAISAYVLSGCAPAEKPETNAVSKEVAQALASRDSIIEGLTLAFDKVDANLDIIRDKEAQLRDWAEGEEILGDREDRIVRDIQVINTLMASNREEIATLRERIKKSGINISSLETRLNHMEMASIQKTAEIDELKQQLVSAQTSLASLNDTLGSRDMRIAMQGIVIETQSTIITEQDKKMHTGYVATGTYKELKDRGLVDKKGALLGVIGGQKEFTAKTDPEEFVAIDQRDQVRIPVMAKKVELVTDHPEGSYKINRDEEGEWSVIDITDPKAFWESSPYLVVAME